MTNLITPPPELVQQWANASPVGIDEESWGYEMFIAHHAAQWGADQELEACCEWASKYLPYLGDFPMPEDKLRAARRPKPPSLKQQALEALERSSTHADGDRDTIRRALEALPMTDLITPPLELVQRVATTLHGVTNSDPNAPVDEWMPEARAVIYVVAAWLREQEAGQ
jgi:hypothetical protein